MVLKGKLKVKVDTDPKFQKLKKLLEPARIRIGVLASSRSKGKVSLSQLVKYASIHEYGGVINHPGGTSYGFKTKSDIAKGKIRFLKKGRGAMELGVTGPHKIKIPERSYLRGTLDVHSREIRDFVVRALQKMIKTKGQPKRYFKIIGQKAVALVKERIANAILWAKPLKPSTIKKKGSAAPLVDEGRLKGSITYDVKMRRAKK